MSNATILTHPAFDRAPVQNVRRMADCTGPLSRADYDAAMAELAAVASSLLAVTEILARIAPPGDQR